MHFEYTKKASWIWRCRSRSAVGTAPVSIVFYLRRRGAPQAHAVTGECCGWFGRYVIELHAGDYLVSTHCNE